MKLLKATEAVQKEDDGNQGIKFLKELDIEFEFNRAELQPKNWDYVRELTPCYDDENKGLYYAWDESDPDKGMLYIGERE